MEQLGGFIEDNINLLNLLVNPLVKRFECIDMTDRYKRLNRDAPLIYKVSFGDFSINVKAEYLYDGGFLFSNYHYIEQIANKLRESGAISIVRIDYTVENNSLVLDISTNKKVVRFKIIDYMDLAK